MLSKLRKLSIIVLVIAVALIVRHYWYSLKVTNSLAYPEQPESLFLMEQQTITVRRGGLKEEYIFGVGMGEFKEVLRNRHGSFYLAPPLGFFKHAGRTTGLSVGGIHVPSGVGEPVCIWEYLLKNKERSFSNPNTARTLSREHDQPERESFLDPTWYKNKGFSLLGRPMIDTDFSLDRSLFLSMDKVEVRDGGVRLLDPAPTEP